MTKTVAPWAVEARRRFVTAWIWKALATTIGIGTFFVSYFWVAHNPQDLVFTMPLIALDSLIPIQPSFMPLYLSLWLYVSIAPALLHDAQALARYGLACFVMSALGLSIFLFWPTATPDFGIDWTAFPSMMFLKSVDTSANACPSLHVAFAVFSGFWLDRLLRDIGLGVTTRLLNLLWCAGIVYSTVALRQHVVLDVAAGAVLGALVALGSLAAEKATPTIRQAAGGPTASGAALSRKVPLAGR